MRMTTIEKVIMAGRICLFVFVVFSVYSCNRKLEDAGGVSAIAVSVGKEIKSIQKQIGEE